MGKNIQAKKKVFSLFQASKQGFICSERLGRVLRGSAKFENRGKKYERFIENTRIFRVIFRIFSIKVTLLEKFFSDL